MASSSRLAPPDPGWALGAAPDDDQTGWLITFSDLVLQLFAFVLVATVLGGSHRADQAQPGPPAPAREAVALQVAAAAEPSPPAPVLAAGAPIAPAIEPRLVTSGEAPVEPPHDDAPAVRRVAALEGYLHELARAAGRADAVAVRVDDADVVVTLNDTIAFPSGGADLLSGAVPILGAIRTLAASLADFAVHVEGHTDDVHIHTAAFPSNLELSLARAARVARELVAGDGALVARTAASGFGEHRPVASNADAAGRARNRRVEIRLVRQEPAGG